MLIAVDQAGSVLGALGLSPTTHFTGEHDAYIGELAVAPHAARRGIGRALIGAAEAWARERGLAHLTLHTGGRPRLLRRPRLR